MRDGKWTKASGPQHDYPAFSATAKSLYSSEKLGLEGETDKRRTRIADGGKAK